MPANIVAPTQLLCRKALKQRRPVTIVNQAVLVKYQPQRNRQTCVINNAQLLDQSHHYHRAQKSGMA